MKPFTIYHSITESFPGQQERMVSLILESVQPDIIYLLGASLYRRRSESIFCPTSPSSQHISDYYFLVLINNSNHRSLPQWQDQIEQHCSTVMPVTIILLESAQFNGWLIAGNLFARTVYRCAIPVFEEDNLTLSPVGPYNTETEQKTLEKLFRDGLNRSQEFLAGVDLFRVRKQYGLAVFMLHQATEQALGTLIKIGTGFHCCTHNIERLLRYAGMVSYQISDIFSRKTDNEKKLFNFLQKAYIESRYREGYSIGFTELLELTERVRVIQDILAEYGKTIFQKKMTNQPSN
jgi:HEPN domain-containing protein